MSLEVATAESASIAERYQFNVRGFWRCKFRRVLTRLAECFGRSSRRLRRLPFSIDPLVSCLGTVVAYGLWRLASRVLEGPIRFWLWELCASPTRCKEREAGEVVFP